MNCKECSVRIPVRRKEHRADFDFRYQWLNHYALFSGGYREDAVDCMEKLVSKYGKDEGEGEDSSSS